MAEKPPYPLGDMDVDLFRQHARRIGDWLANYFDHPESYPVLARAKPGEIRAALPAAAPNRPEPFGEILEDFERLVLPGITHWNHPGFFAYFAISGSAPGVLAEFLSAGLNVQAMLWRTSPAATELEEVTLSWLRQLIGLPESFEGVIYDTASISTLHALAAARQIAVPDVREYGLTGHRAIGGLRVYCSEHAHSSVDKAVILLGLGQLALRKIVVNDRFEMQPEALRAAITEDRSAGLTPVAVVATVGTTSTTSVDPLEAIAEICAAENIWLHVDAAYAGVAAILPEYREILRGAAGADSFVVNPHKWLFTPFDLSAFYSRRMEVVRQTFSLVPDYLQTADAGQVRNLMDTGIQLGRRFRALKLWMVLRYFGAEGIRGRIAEHIRLARLFAGWVDAHGDFERLAPVPFSVVCFRAKPAGRRWTDEALDSLNERLLDRVNASGEVFLSHTRIDGHFALRLAVGHIRTTEVHVKKAWDVLNDCLPALLDL